MPRPRPTRKHYCPCCPSCPSCPLPYSQLLLIYYIFTISLWGAMSSSFRTPPGIKNNMYEIRAYRHQVYVHIYMHKHKQGKNWRKITYDYRQKHNKTKTNMTLSTSIYVMRPFILYYAIHSHPAIYCWAHKKERYNFLNMQRVHKKISKTTQLFHINTEYSTWPFRRICYIKVSWAHGKQRVSGALEELINFVCASMAEREKGSS